MQNKAINHGRILIIIGVIGYAYGLFSGSASVTALIPAAFGIVIVLLGYGARAKPSMSKHLMHAALVFALIGFIVPLIRIFSKMSTFSLSAATISMIAMSLTCLSLMVFGIRSFQAARAS